MTEALLQRATRARDYEPRRNKQPLAEQGRIGYLVDEKNSPEEMGLTKSKGMIMDVVKVGKSFSIKIPSTARKKMGLQEGDRLQIDVLKRGEAVLRALSTETWAEAVIDKVIRDVPNENPNDVPFDRQFEELQEAIWSRTDQFAESEVERDVAEAIRRVRGKRHGRR